MYLWLIIRNYLLLTYGIDLIGDFNLTGFNPLNFKAQIIVKEAGHAVHGIVARELKDKLVEI